MNINELKATIGELVNETLFDISENVSPAVKVVVSTINGGTKVFMYREGNEEFGADASVTTYTPFSSILKSKDVPSSRLTQGDRDVLEVLNLLSDEEVAKLVNKESIVTTNIPEVVLNKYATSKPDSSDLSEINMKNQEYLISLIKQMIAEEFKGEPNNAAEVESDELTSHLSEDNSNEDIKDLEKLLANPDPSRAKDYGSIENYKKMLRQKIDRLKKKSANEAVVNKAKNIIAKKKTRCC